MKIESKKDLLVSPTFSKAFGNADVTPAKTLPPFMVLPRYMNNAEIIEELKVEKCTLADVAAFIENPPKERLDGNWNMFFVRDFVVVVLWGVRDGRLYVDAFPASRPRVWYGGSRVFGGVVPSEPLSSVGHSDALTPLGEAIQMVKDAGYVVYKLV